METIQQIKDSWLDFGDESNEETLSLCDLVMNDGFSEQDHHNSNNNNNNNDNLFEFFNKDFHASPSTFPENNIFFCGKTISYRENQPNVGKCKSKQENEEKKKKFSIRNSCLFPWKISSPVHPFNKSRTFPSSSKPTKESQRKSFNKSYSMPTSVTKNKYEKFGVENNKFNGEKFDFSVKKVSTLASPVKSRWYLFAFGVGRFPMEIELKDMKMRQSRKLKAMKCQALGSGGGDGGDISENVKGDNGRRSGKVLWRLLKVLG